MTEKKRTPTRRQTEALADQRAHGRELIGWWQQRAGVLEKALKKLLRIRRRKTAASGGAARVPAQYRVYAKPPEPVHLPHEDDNRATRTARAFWTDGNPDAYSRKGRRAGRVRVTAPGRNRPYVNPERDEKSHAAGRLRQELRP